MWANPSKMFILGTVIGGIAEFLPSSEKYHLDDNLTI